jgi:hypothetical protein
MTTVLYRGNGSGKVRIGSCWTDELRIAAAYADASNGKAGVVVEAEVDFAGLVVLDGFDVEDYDPDTDRAPGDDGDFERWGADVIVYEDEDPYGRRHMTWRLLTEKAVSAVKVREVRPIANGKSSWWLL